MPGVSFQLPIWFDLAAVFLFALTGVWAAVYAVYGANKSLVAGVSPEAAVLVGLCNAVGGGLLRDVVVRDEPMLLKPGQLYFLATLVGCIGFVVLSHHYGVDVQFAAYSAIAVTMLLRVLAIRLNWRTAAFGALWRRRDDTGTGPRS